MKVGTITSEPFFRFKALTAISRAIVPLVTVGKIFYLQFLKICFSNFLLNSPFEDNQLVFIHFFRFVSSLLQIIGLDTFTLI